MRRSRFALPAVSLCALLVSGCGGGGGGGGPSTIPAPPTTSTPSPSPTPSPTPTPTPTPVITTPPTSQTPAPTPTPSPTPTPTPSVADTAEYRRSNGLTQANALAAYNSGASGIGIVAAVIDSGISNSSGEFTGRISTASADVAGTRGTADEDGHGTEVASYLAAARNDQNIMGAAYAATLLVARADSTGSCATSDGCKFSDAAIAKGIDLATQNRARVINISLGGDRPGSALLAALSRATAAGIVVVIAAGNDGNANPSDFALIANDPAARGLVIIAGASDATGDIASFSDRAGTGAAAYLIARGDRLAGIDPNYLYSGTSFAAPLISGAVALLAQAFPNLTGAQIVELLKASAVDLGTRGVDSTYGNGRLDLTRAFQPQGSTSLAGSAVAVSTAQNAALSPAMGDAAPAGLSTVMVDGYGRAYRLNLGATIERIGERPRLAPALAQGLRTLTMNAPGATIAVTVSASGSRPAVERLTLQPEQARVARATAGFIAARTGLSSAFALGLGQDGARLQAGLRGARGEAFLVTSDADAPGFERRVDQSLAFRRAIGNGGAGIVAEAGDALAPRMGLRGATDLRWRRLPYSLVGLTMDQRVGPVTLGAAVSRLRERETVLGARFSSLFGAGATTTFVDVSAQLEAGRWLLSAAWRGGWTRMDGSGAVRSASLRSTSFAVGAARSGLILADDRFALRLAQPLRVASGGYGLMLPVGYDPISGAADVALRRFDLAPRGRELDIEASWYVLAGPGWVGTNLFWRREPGNIATAPADAGGAIRYSLSF